MTTGLTPGSYARSPRGSYCLLLKRERGEWHVRWDNGTENIAPPDIRPCLHVPGMVLERVEDGVKAVVSERFIHFTDRDAEGKVEVHQDISAVNPADWRILHHPHWAGVVEQPELQHCGNRSDAPCECSVCAPPAAAPDAPPVAEQREDAPRQRVSDELLAMNIFDLQSTPPDRYEYHDYDQQAVLAMALDLRDARALIAQQARELADTKYALSVAGSAMAQQRATTEQQARQIAALEQQNGALLDAINWATGCTDDFEPPSEKMAGHYWWRSELVKRAGLDYNPATGLHEALEAARAALPQPAGDATGGSE